MTKNLEVTYVPTIVISGKSIGGATYTGRLMKLMLRAYNENHKRVLIYITKGKCYDEVWKQCCKDLDLMNDFLHTLTGDTFPDIHVDFKVIKQMK